MLPLHHDLNRWSGVCVSIDVRSTCSAPLVCSVSANGRPENRSSARPGFQPDMGNQPSTTAFKSGRWDSNPRTRVPKTRGLAAALHPDSVQSERSDLNQRSLGPQSSAMTNFRHALSVLRPQWAHEVLEPSYPDLPPGATPSQLPAQRKKPDVVVTPGFEMLDRQTRPSVTSAGDARAANSPVDRRIVLRIAADLWNSAVRSSF